MHESEMLSEIVEILKLASADQLCAVGAFVRSYLRDEISQAGQSS